MELGAQIGIKIRERDADRSNSKVRIKAQRVHMSIAWTERQVALGYG